MDISKLRETALFLGKDADAALLDKMMRLENEGYFCMTFWGHFSAGKSRLINSILNRDLLPMQSRETTAAMTYIKYGEDEKCVIVHNDGNKDVRSITDLKRIFQNSNEAIDVSSIDYIEAFVDSKLLVNGLVIVDTPGINTIIQRHNELAMESIGQAGKIFYVLGGSPTDIDRKYIQLIEGCGIEQYFVRTKCDKFKEEEENADESLQKEKEELHKIMGHDLTFIPVSNEQDSSWFGNIEVIRDELASLSQNAQQEMSHTIKSRCAVYVQKYSALLKEQLKLLTEKRQGKAADLDTRIDSCQQRIAMLESMASRNEKRIKENIESSKRNAKRELVECCENRISEFSHRLEDVSPSGEIIQEVTSLYDSNIHNAVGLFHGILSASLDGLVAMENDVQNEDLSAFVYKGNAPSYREVELENSEMLDTLRLKIERERETLERLKQEQKNLEACSDAKQSEYDEAGYDAKLAELSELYAQIPSGAALRMKTEIEVQPSKIFKEVGRAVDLALLVLPGGTVVQGAKTVANGTKIASALQKAGKAGEAVAKAGKVISENAKAIDTVRDVTYTMNQVFGKNDSFKGEPSVAIPENKKNKLGNVLDALSVEYWAEKIGKELDSPPSMEIDVEVENMRNQKRSEIFAKQQAISREKIEKHKELGLIRTRQQEMDEKIAENEQAILRTEKELERCKVEDERLARKAALRKYVDSYVAFFRDAIESIANQMYEAYYRKAEPNIGLYVASRNKRLTGQIQEEKAAFENLKFMVSTDEIDGAIEKINCILKELETA